MVSIITVNYNGWRDTCELIDSLRQHETYPYEVIVVDNASAADDVQQIRRAHPEVRVVASERNLGFAGGNNLGMQYATGDYFFFLNNDIVIKAPLLRQLVHLFSQGNVGAVAPCIRYFQQPDKMQYCGYQEMTPITLRHTTKPYHLWPPEAFLHPFVTQAMHGAAMMLSRETIERVGKMSEAYFLFYEEFDWCRRIRQAGLDIWCDPTVSVYHKESVSIPKRTPLRAYYMSRSRMLYARRSNTGLARGLSILYHLFVVLPLKAGRHIGSWPMVSAFCRGTFAGLLAHT